MKIYFISILSILTVLLIGCPNYGMTVGETPIVEVLETSTDVEKEITIKCHNLPIFDETKEMYTKEIWFIGTFYVSNYKLIPSEDTIIGYNGGAIKVQRKEKLSNYIAKFTVPKNIATGKIGVPAFKGAFGETNILKINYPKYLTLSNNKANTGDEITITSSKSFFDETTFTKEKLNKMLDIGYFIVWMSGTPKKEYLTSKPDVHSIGNGNTEKIPVEKEYYVIDKITPYSVTFKIPPEATTGTIHIVNEHGFTKPDNTSDNTFIIAQNDYAYYSTTEELIIK